jgi:pyruvate/2-oxoglutarate dehydrogenase complex dihydrolipoamide dehydrogenase (E3) component
LHLPGIGPGNEVAMSSGKPAEKFDTIIIGTGQSGKPLALALGRAGRKTAVVERKHVGGTCINVGCTPTKTMVASARVAYLARRGADFGVHTSAPRVDLAEVWRRKQGVVEQFRGGGQRGLESVSAIDLMFGEGSFVDAHTVRVALNDGGERHLTADRVVINTGGRPAVPAIPGLKEVDWLDSSSIMELQVLPPHLVVLGGGYIGLEFSQMFRRFGARVTVITRDDRLIPREDPDVSAEVEKILVEDGIGIVKNANTLRAAGRGGVTVTVDTPEGRREIGGSHLLVAIGRAPNSDRLNLQAAGIAADKAGFISVNNRLETAVPGIYAIGDVKGGPAFTHISYDDYRVLRANWLEGGNATIDGRHVPNTMFIDPQLATVGLNETEARKRGLNYRVAKLPMTSVARAIEMGETRGFMKAIVDADTREILGCTVLGIEGGEVMSMLQIAMMGGLPYPALREAIFAHPTLAEALNNLFGTVA